jgi:hypothetical protein
MYVLSGCPGDVSEEGKGKDRGRFTCMKVVGMGAVVARRRIGGIACVSDVIFNAGATCS